MYKNKTILAIIPARHGSKGLPGKNWKKINGKPLIAWTIQQAKNSKLIDAIIISTDSKNIIIESKKYKNKKIEIYKRPEYLATDKTGMFNVLADVILKKDKSYDYVLLLQPTSPLRKKEDIDNFIKNLIEKKEINSSISMCKIDTWANPENCFKANSTGFINGFSNNLLNVKTRQENNNNYYYPNGSMFMSKKESLLKNKTFYQNNSTVGFLMEKWQQFDIDDAEDFDIVESVLKTKDV